MISFLQSIDPMVLIPIVVFAFTMAAGAVYLVIRAQRRKPVVSRLREIEDDEATAAAEWDAIQPEVPSGGSTDTTGGLAEAITKPFASSKPSDNLKAQLAHAGFHEESAATVYLGSKMLLFVGGALIVAAALMLFFGVWFPYAIAAGVFAGGILSFVPNMYVHSKRQKRREAIRNHLPDAVDLLEICVASGMGLDMAWNQVSEQIRGVSPHLADEMALSNLEMHIGASRSEALRHMVDRTGAEDLASLVAVLIQSERFGTSISEALKTFSETMREMRSMRAEESAEKMAVKLLFPMILFIFPVVLIVVAGPAGIQIADVMFGK